MNQPTMIPDHVLITGGTGFIGSALAERLLARGSRVSVLTRDRERAHRQFDGKAWAIESMGELGASDPPDVIVNLAGKNLASERWDDEVKRELIASRVGTTEQVVDYIREAESKPGLLISGSAVGYYGARGNETLSETDSSGDEFQSILCEQWEAAALRAREFGVRVCLSRTGVVMGRDGGALAGLAPMFRLGLGAIAGRGDQWISWIHRDDLINIFFRFMDDQGLDGAFNNTAPHPVTNREFSKTLGRILRRPVWLRVPGWLMRLQMGEMAHLYLTGQKVIPSRHLDNGFEFSHPDIGSALAAALR
jgi:uncharacterized protein (TIGR01777 family)